MYVYLMQRLSLTLRVTVLREIILHISLNHVEISPYRLYGLGQIKIYRRTKRTGTRTSVVVFCAVNVY